MSTTSRAAVGVAVALVAVLAGCSKGDGGSGSGDLSYEDSPLASYWSAFDVMGDMTIEEQQAFYDEQNRRQEDLMAQCMAEQGFEYNATGAAGTTIISDGSEDDGPQWGTLEFAQQYGYGAFAWPGQEDYSDEGSYEEWVDPNQEIMDSMSESELMAWQEALWGAQDYEYDPDAEVEEYEYNWEDNGCYGWAQHEVEQDNPYAALSTLMEDPRFAELFEQLNTFYNTLETDPRMAELTAEWSACMADAGYTFATPNDAQNSIYDALNKFWEDNADNPEYTGPTDEETEAIKTREIETAVADFTCQEKIDYSDEQLRIQFEIEQDFVDNNKAALEEFSAAAQELAK